MRYFLLVLMMTPAACAKEQPPKSGLPTGTFIGDKSDAFCIAGDAAAQRAGFVVYGADGANCAASGTVEPTGAQWTLIPAGDEACKIPFSVDANRIILGAAAPSCAYYCGPRASFVGKSFDRSETSKPAADIAGDPLC